MEFATDVDDIFIVVWIDQGRFERAGQQAVWAPFVYLGDGYGAAAPTSSVV
ncbi:hypothetical protein [Parapedobacter sp. 2B3]|uniref:hypothetical protein n=1 Tax=Parapedobacter sp. 2B3 TaxID=3342381 RepID=UPI0035B68E1C